MKPGASKAMSKSRAATCRCHEMHCPLFCDARAANQSPGAWIAGGDDARRNEHEVVGVRVAVEAAASQVACCVLVCAPVYSCVVPV
jgi:hypothetical protein